MRDADPMYTRGQAHRHLLCALALGLALLLVGCTSTPFSLSASGPFAYSTAVGNPALERVAILVTIGNRTGDDLQINPADFVVRDADRHIFTSNPTATLAEARQVSGPLSMRGALPLPTVTLRSDDVLAGFVVFDIPSGIQPVELIWRQSDTDSMVKLVPST